MDIARQVVSAKDSDGKIIASITDYYDRFVHPMGDKYKQSSFTKDKLVLCPFHGDINPSMGKLKDKHDKQIEVFHCFGCGASGDVVRMHRRLVYINEGRSISLEEATYEIANIYGIEIDINLAEQQLASLLGKREAEIEQNLGVYNFRSHSANLMKIRMVQDKLSIASLGENLDVVLTKWKMAIKDANK